MHPIYVHSVKDPHMLRTRFVFLQQALCFLVFMSLLVPWSSDCSGNEKRSVATVSPFIHFRSDSPVDKDDMTEANELARFVTCADQLKEIDMPTAKHSPPMEGAERVTTSE